MITFIEKYFKVLVILLLLILCVLLYARQSIGRYMLCPRGDGWYVFVLDTKTSRLWLRGSERDIDLGTLQNPIKDIILKPNY